MNSTFTAPHYRPLARGQAVLGMAMGAFEQHYRVRGVSKSETRNVASARRLYPVVVLSPKAPPQILMSPGITQNEECRLSRSCRLNGLSVR